MWPFAHSKRHEYGTDFNLLGLSICYRPELMKVSGC